MIFLLKQLYMVLNKIYIIPSFFKMKFFRVKFGKGIKISGNIFILNKGSITLGNNVRINSNVVSCPVGGPYKTSFLTFENGKITIGNNVGMSGTSIVSKECVTVEDGVFLGSGCCIYDNDFHSLYYNERISVPEKGIKSKPVKICKGAFIGARSFVLKGVTVGEQSVVGAGSVVTKDIPPFEVWAGNPAKFIKSIDKTVGEAVCC